MRQCGMNEQEDVFDEIPCEEQLPCSKKEEAISFSTVKPLIPLKPLPKAFIVS